MSGVSPAFRGTESKDAERYQAAARTALGDEACVAAWQIGQTLSLEEQMRE